MHVKLREAEVEFLRRLLGDRDRETVSASAELVLAYLEAGQPDKAREICERIRDALSQDRDVNNPDAPWNMTQLGLLYVETGQPSEGLRLIRESLRRHVRLFGKNNRDTLMTARSMAVGLKKIGKTGRCLLVLKYVIRKMSEVLGDDHPLTKHCRRLYRWYVD